MEREIKRIAKFFKVSPERFYSDFENISKTNNFEKAGENEKQGIYENIILPERATKGSAGYDFFMPYDVTLCPGETITVPTGIRCRMERGYVLVLFPRSGLGFKYRLRLDNTAGIIDEDYYYSDNEGHIIARITNENTEGKTCVIEKGKGFIQGILLPFGITEDDRCEAVRNGGFGSTT